MRSEIDSFDIKLSTEAVAFLSSVDAEGFFSQSLIAVFNSISHLRASIVSPSLVNTRNAMKRRFNFVNDLEAFSSCLTADFADLSANLIFSADVVHTFLFDFVTELGG